MLKTLPRIKNIRQQIKAIPIVVWVILIISLLLIAGLLFWNSQRLHQLNQEINPLAQNNPSSTTTVKKTFLRLNCQYYSYDNDGLAQISLPESQAAAQQPTDVSQECFRRDQIFDNSVFLETYSAGDGVKLNLEAVDLAKATRQYLGEFENAAYALTQDEKTLYEYSNGVLSKIDLATKATTILFTQPREIAGRGGITGDEQSISLNSSEDFILINDTLAFQETNLAQDTAKIQIFKISGEKVADLAGYKARWLNNLQVIIVDDQKLQLSTYSVNNKQLKLIYTDPQVVNALIQDLQVGDYYLYVDGFVDSKHTYNLAWQLTDSTTPANQPETFPADLVSPRYLADDQYLALLAKPCEITEFPEGDVTNIKNTVGAVQCPIDGDNELYTYQLVLWQRSTDKRTVIRDLPVSYV